MLASRQKIIFAYKPMTIEILQAENGDAILISFTDPNQGKRNILIDGGMPQAYRFRNGKKRWEDGALKIKIAELRQKSEKFDLLLLTHVDQDHIGGLIRWIDHDPDAWQMIGKVCFNSGRLIKEHFSPLDPTATDIAISDGGILTSIAEGVSFESYITEHDRWCRQLIISGQCFKIFGVDIKILSPGGEQLEALLSKWAEEEPASLETADSDDHDTPLSAHAAAEAMVTDENYQQDKAVHNGSSVAFLMTWEEKEFLFLGDAHPNVVVDALERLGYSDQRPLQAVLVKISHHGSKGNTSPKLLRMISAGSFIISTNSKKHGHPDKQLMARMVRHHPTCHLQFNYPGLPGHIFSPADRKDFPGFQTTGLNGPLVFTP